MLITSAQLARFSGVSIEDDTTAESLIEIYIGTAQEIITNYVGYDPETYSGFEETTTDDDGNEVTTVEVPAVFSLVCLEIASLIQLEENNNLGVNSKSFGDSGSRSFLNIVDYSPYLKRLSTYQSVGDKGW